MNPVELNYDIIRPLLQHLYPGRFAGLQELVQRGYGIELRLANIDRHLAKLAGGVAVSHDVLLPRDEVWELTTSELQNYIQAIGEIAKLSPMADRKTAGNLNLTINNDADWTDERIVASLAEAKSLGLRVP